MATSTFTLTLTQVSGGNYVPVTTGNYYLRKSPYTANTYTGSHLGDGVWTFGAVTDGMYKLYTGTVGAETQVTKWGEKYIGDDYPESLTGLSISGNGSADNVSFSACQIQIHSGCSTHFHDTNITHVHLINVDEINDSTGHGITAGSKFYYTGNVDEPHVVATKEYVDSAIATTGMYASLSTQNEFTARQLMREGVTIGYSTEEPSTQPYFQVYTLTNFNQAAPFCNADPVINSNQLTRKSYVDAKVDGIVSSLSAYNQDTRILRLHNGGTSESGKVYVTWASAMAGAIAKTPTSANQINIVIEGMGANAYINMAPHGGGTSGYYENVHVTSIIPNCKVNVQPCGSTVTASSISAIKYENIEFFGFGDDTFVFDKVTFKNCTFESTTVGGDDYTFDFHNCKFEGGNYFFGTKAHIFSDCYGDRIACSLKPTVTKTSLAFPLQYSTISGINIGAQTMFDDGTQIRAEKFSIGGTSITGDGSELYVNGTLKSTGASIAGECAITNRLNVTGDATFISNAFTGKATNTLGLSSSEICLSAATLNLVGLTDNVAPNENTSNNLPPNYYGKSESYVLFEPDKFIVVQLNGSNYLIPLYVKA